jgi:flagellar biosynthetic protein FliO
MSAIAFIILSAVAYFVVRRGFSRTRGGGIRLTDSVFLGQNTSVRLIKAGERFLLIGVTKENISLLTELDKSDVSETEETFGRHGAVSFDSVLRLATGRKSGIKRR